MKGTQLYLRKLCVKLSLISNKVNDLSLSFNDFVSKSVITIDISINSICTGWPRFLCDACNQLRDVS
jgi:hypothetical protein